MAKIGVADWGMYVWYGGRYDYEERVKSIKEIGFDGVEFAGYGDLSKEEMKELRYSCNLQAVSSHVGLEELENNLDFQG